MNHSAIKPIAWHGEVLMSGKKRAPVLSVLFLFTLPLLLSGSPLSAAPDARQVIDRVDQTLRGNTSYGTYRITIEKPRLERTLVIESWDDSVKEQSFIRILEPKKDRGTTFLKIKQNLWQYIPRIGKEIKIEGSLMQDSWMGSDFTNDDLVRAYSIVDDYVHTFLSPPDENLYRVEMRPKPGVPVVWTRVVFDIRKKDYLPVKQEFYDHKDRLVRILEYSRYARVDNKVIPTHMKVKSVKGGRTRSSTTMEFLRVRFNQPIPAHIFSRANLRK